MDDRYEARELDLRDGERAVLLSLRAAEPTRTAVLHVHGYADYFFQHHLADHVVAGGRDFYALDLRRSGRSRRHGELPHYVEALEQHFEELDRAAEAIRADGHDALVVFAHSTGGLIVPLWLDALRGSHTTEIVRGVVLNSPWFDLDGSRSRRLAADAMCATVGRLRPHTVVSQSLGAYGRTIHLDHHGEWDFDLTRKPVEGFPVRAGWLRAVRRGQRRLQHGLDVGVPVLVLRSDRSLLKETGWSEALMEADAILDVEAMSRFAPGLGDRVEVAEIPGAMHDVFLSRPRIREHALAIVDGWLAGATL